MQALRAELWYVIVTVQQRGEELEPGARTSEKALLRARCMCPAGAKEVRGWHPGSRPSKKAPKESEPKLRPRVPTAHGVTLGPGFRGEMNDYLSITHQMPASLLPSYRRGH